VVTGASSGLGEEFARQLAKRGYDLVLVARRRELLDTLAAQISDAAGAKAEVIEADLSRTEGVAKVEERLAAGDVQLLVNNAGFGTHGEFHELPLDRELEEIDVNVRALTRLTHAALGPMVRSKGGAVINVASTGAYQPVPYMATYAATKAYVLYFSEALHEEVRPHGVSVTCLCPGPVKTGFQATAGVSAERLRVGWTKPADVVASALNAAKAGSAITVPGVMNKLTAALPRFVPRFMVRKVSGAMFKNAGKQ
jgi:hypothetical protein